MKPFNFLAIIGLICFTTLISCESQVSNSDLVSTFFVEVSSQDPALHIWESSYDKLDSHLGDVLAEKFSSSDLITVIPAEDKVTISLEERGAFPLLFARGLEPTLTFDGEIVCASSNPTAFALCIKGYLENGHHLEIWQEDDTYYTRLLD